MIWKLVCLASFGLTVSADYTAIYPVGPFKVHVPDEYNSNACINGTFYHDSPNAYTINYTAGSPGKKGHPHQNLYVKTGQTVCHRQSALEFCISKLTVDSGVMEKGCGESDNRFNFNEKSHGIVYQRGSMPMSNFASTMDMIHHRHHQRKKVHMVLAAIAIAIILITTVSLKYKCFCKK